MATYWVLNLDAEYELAEPKGYQPAQAVQRAFEGALDWARELLAPEDFELSLREIRDGRAKNHCVRAWCPTETVRAACRAGGAQLADAPNFEILRRVNSRAFTSEFAEGLSGAHFFRPSKDLVNEVRRHLATRSANWLLKRAWSVAGRGARRVDLARWAQADENWIRASARKGGLQVEPFVQVEAEFSLHGWNTPAGTVTLGTPCRVLPGTRDGALRIRQVQNGELTSREQASLIREAEGGARRLHWAGYFGPFGIDAYRWRSGNQVYFQALSELNARYTLAWACGMRTPEILSRL